VTEQRKPEQFLKSRFKRWGGLLSRRTLAGLSFERVGEGRRVCAGLSAARLGTRAANGRSRATAYPQWSRKRRELIY
jgi:hypothetical protein